MRSGQHLADDFAVDIGEAEVPAHVAVGEPCVVEPKAVEYSRLQIVNGDLVFHDVQAELVGATATANSPADGEGISSPQ